MKTNFTQLRFQKELLVCGYYRNQTTGDMHLCCDPSIFFRSQTLFHFKERHSRYHFQFNRPRVLGLGTSTFLFWKLSQPRSPEQKRPALKCVSEQDVTEHTCNLSVGIQLSWGGASVVRGLGWKGVRKHPKPPELWGWVEETQQVWGGEVS